MENNMTDSQFLAGLREDIKQMLIDLKKRDTLSFPAVAEVVLAQRHLEDARMRLGVAAAYLDGKDPLGAK